MTDFTKPLDDQKLKASVRNRSKDTTMKRIFLASAMLTVPMFAQSATLSSINNQCAVDGISSYLTASNYASKIINAPRYDGMQMVWKDAAEARYCPNVIARYDAAADRKREQANSEFQADLRRYGQ
jgi:hypothetical protein